ncbi:hypothetical protein HELRODRAFT_184011 [Helobdella robusta]|uniref:Uncharacterized protein n=1 Tax=Helobdella robusta TaxID=6412 RepID=T1FKF2_HELRO|nr:hypothetical protein HELRODRAFT_184011 [Helobdella robusta]ESO09621.1 hypothetical protein HELRODRAFT_184011 [Helobdella robusta]
MATRQVVANEVLYFLSNNFDLFDNDNFIANTSDFYTNEDFISALKTLKTELETQNLDKLDKLVGRGNTKKEKLLDCVSILKYLKNNSVLEKCSLFASVNLAKVPNLDNIIKVNFKNLKNEIKEMLYAQQVKIVNAIDMHGIEISTLNNKINFLASKRDNYNFASHSSNTSTAIFPEKNNIVTMPNPANSATLWSDVVQSPLEDNPLPFSIVARNKKRPRLNNSPETNQPNPAITSNKLESSKLPTKIVGAKKNDNNKLSADKKLIKKSVFAISNIKKCSRSNVIDYLSEVGIQFKTTGPKIWKLFVPQAIQNITNKQLFKKRLQSQLYLLHPDTTI